MLTLAIALCGVSVQGTVRSGARGEPIPYALVETTDGMARTESDSTGRYQLSCLPQTNHGIRFSRLGFDPRTVEVSVADGDTIELDVDLSGRPLALPPVPVTGTRSGAGPVGLNTLDSLAPGTRTFSPSEISLSPLVGTPDPLQGLPVADVLTGGDPIAGSHVRGGSADQNLTLLDGVPIYYPYHAGGVSALSLDAISRVTLQSGVPSARWSGGLSSVTAAETRTADPGGVAWHGSVDPLWMGQFWSSRILGGSGDMLVGGRLTNPVLGQQDHGHGPSGADGLARVTVPLFGGGLELLCFGSQDRVGLDTVVSPPGTADWQPGTGDRGTDNIGATAAGNTFGWTTQTEALMWTGPTGHPTTMAVRLWRTVLDATGSWLAATPLSVTDAMRTIGAAATLSGPVFSSRGEIGVEADRFGTTYDVGNPGNAMAGPYLHETAGPVILAGFVEDRWQSSGGRWGMTTGLRSDVAPWGPVALEPRITTRFTPTPTVSLAAAWGESRQYVQSLSNPESILGAVVGMPLPIAANGNGLPVGHADQWTGTLTLRPAPGTILTLDGYARRMDGLLLVAPVTAQPFATDSIAIGSGQASGILLSVEHQTSRVTIQALYAYGTTTRTALGASYVPAAGATNSLAAGISAQVRDGVVLRAALWAAFGRQTTLINDSVAWSPPSELGGVGDLDGTPQSLRGPLDGQPLPGYVRLDLGARREWTSIFGHAMRVTGSIAVDNVLGRANVAALLAPGIGATTDPLYYTGRTLSVRMEWNH